MAPLGALKSYTHNFGSRRAFFFTLAASGIPSVIPLGEHSHLMIENMGATTVQLYGASEATASASAVDWLEVSTNKVLDGDTDTQIILGAVGGGSVRITVWGNPREESLRRE